MNWYNPRTWFRSGPDPIPHCDSPRCGHPIDDEKVVYDRGNRRIYHDPQCFDEGMMDLAAKQGVSVANDVREIHRDKAVKLLKNGRLEQEPHVYDV